MGLLESILGSLLGGSSSSGGSLARLALQLIQQSGGLEGLLGKFKEAGLGTQADSWVGTGANLPISAEQMQQALGGTPIGDLAGRLGLNAGDALSGLSSLLPTLIDKMTPQGQVPADAGDLVSQVLSAMGGPSGRG